MPKRPVEKVSISEEIKNIKDNLGDSWNSDEYRKFKNQMYDENFKKNFKDVSRKEIGKEFHKKMKNFTGYTTAQTIADLEEGPFISDKD